jgi:hypothetical protein
MWQASDEVGDPFAACAGSGAGGHFRGGLGGNDAGARLKVHQPDNDRECETIDD